MQNDEQTEIAAPGDDVTSTVTQISGSPFNNNTWSDISIACPHEEGVDTVGWSHLPECAPNQIKDTASLEYDGINGHSYQKAKAAINFLETNVCRGGNDGPEPRPQPQPKPHPQPRKCKPLRLFVWILSLLCYSHRTQRKHCYAGQAQQIFRRCNLIKFLVGVSLFVF